MRLNDYLARKYGTNYREALRQTAQETGLAPGEEAIEQDTNFLSNLGAGGYSLLNELTMGIPDFLVKNIGGEQGSKALEDLRKYHKTATDIGGGIGTVGSLFIPGGAVVKGVGLGAKAIGAAKAADKLGKAADFLKGGELTGNLAQKIGQGAIRGAGQGLEQGVVRGVTNLDFTSPEKLQESAHGSLEGIGTGAGLGALGGAILGPAVQKLLGRTKLKDKVSGKEGEFGEGGARFHVGELREVLDDATLKDAGISTRGLRSAINKLGYQRRASAEQAIEAYKADLAKAIRDQGIRGKRSWEALRDKNQQQWKDIDDSFVAINPDKKLWEPKLRDALLKDKDLQDFIDESGAPDLAYKAFDKAMEFVTDRTDINAIRRAMSNYIRRYIRSPDADQQLQAQTAIVIKNKLDDFIAENSGKLPEEITDAKFNYKLLQPFELTEARYASDLGNFFDQGPGTAEKAFLQSVLANYGASSGLGGAVGIGSALSQQNATGEEFDLGKALAAGATGALAGGVLKKALPNLGNRALAALGRRGASQLEKEGVRKTIESGLNLGRELPRVPAALGAKAGEAQQEDIPELSTQPEEIQQGTNVSTGSPDLSPRLKYVLGNRLNYLYSTQYADQLSPDEFMERIRAKTDNFQNHESLANLLFDDPKEQENYTRQVQAYRDLKDVDLDKILKGPGGLEIPGIGRIGGDEEIANDYDKFVNTILTLRNEGDILKRTDAQEKQLRKALAMVKKNPEMLQQFLESTGINFGQLRDLGVI